ncbi:MAG: hypothetical protein AAB524_00440 [Patescibacteria group bacterium]
MTFEIIKHERETNQSLIRRFTKRLRESGILVGVKKSVFRHRQKSKQMVRRATLRRLEKQKEYQRLLKLGQIEKK